MPAETTSHFCSKRRTQSANWSELHGDLLESILKRLSFTDILRFKVVCSSWYSAAQACITSSSSYSTAGFHRTPWLMIPPTEGEKAGDCRFFNLEEKRIYNLKDTAKELGHECRCVGSSHGWLIQLDERPGLYLLNPFSRARIQLPGVKTFSSTLKFIQGTDGSFVIQDMSPRYYPDYCCYESKTDLRNKFIAKAILSSDPSQNNNYRVIVLYFQSSKLAFCSCGDSTWTNVPNGKHRSYSDIMFYNRHLFALADEAGSIEVWDFKNSRPTKSMEIKTSCLVRDVQFSTRLYLVESLDDLLVVVRSIGDSVNHDGQVVEEAELYSDESNHPLVCPYRTLLFDVYKLDFNQKKWVEVRSLGDRLFFLGGNHSLSCSAKDVIAEENSIYFTDDNWDRMNEDYLYGGHDMGVFNLEDKTIEPIYLCDSWKIEPPPFWVVPNPW